MRGTLAPGAELAALRTAVYRPGATAGDVEALERALTELREEAGTGEPPASAGAVAPPADRVVQRAGRDGGPGPRRAWPVLAALGVTLGGCAAGVALALLAQPAGPTAATVPTAVHIATTASDAVFRRAQRAADRPGVPLDPALVPASTRRLLGAGRIQLYAAIDRTGRRCLLGVQGGSVLSCVAPERFARAGLRVLWSSDVLAVDPAGLRQLTFRLSLAAEWRPDGRVLLGAVRP